MNTDPCPHCGYCPTCKRAAGPVYPQPPFYPWLQPWWQQKPYPVYPIVTHIGTPASGFVSSTTTGQTFNQVTA